MTDAIAMNSDVRAIFMAVFSLISYMRGVDETF